MEIRPHDAKDAQRVTSRRALILCGPPLSKCQTPARRTAAGIFFLAALLCQVAFPAHAANKPPLAWACWISEQEPISIKCIRDRSHLRRNAPDNFEAALMNLRPPEADDALPGPSAQPLHGGPDSLDPLDQAEQDDTDNELEAEVLDQIYSKILVGDTARLDDLVERHSSDLPKDSVWMIKIHSLPLDSSWLENRPARIVKSALCRGHPSCSVILREPGR